MQISRRQFLGTGVAALAGTLLSPLSAVAQVYGAACRRRRELWAMGGWHFIDVTAPIDEVAVAAEQAAVETIRRLDRTFSVFDSRSELSRLNSAPSRVTICENGQVIKGLARAMELAKSTGGAFDPTVECLMHQFGFRGLPANTASGSRPWNHGSITVDQTRNQLLRESPEIALDPGAWVKGWAADQAVDAARVAGATTVQVNCGGDICRRSESGDSAWEVLIRDPAGGRTDSVLSVAHDFPCVATSANYESNRRLADGMSIGHLMDPRTQQPSDSTLQSVTVFANDGLTADAAASALFVMGVSDAGEWLRHYPQCAAVLLDRGWRRDPTQMHVVGRLEVRDA